MPADSTQARTWTPPPLVRHYLRYLRLERGFSPNTLAAYEHDLRLLSGFLADEHADLRTVQLGQLQTFVATLSDTGISPRSIARILSGVRSFYGYLVMEHEIDADPTELLQSPSRSERLPDVLSVAEIDAIIAAIDTECREARRDRAIIETLYSCGLRVSELCTLRVSDLYLADGFLRVTGKGRKQRLVPVSPTAIGELTAWFADRDTIAVRPGHEDYVFLSLRRGTRLSRITVFHIVKQLCLRAGVRSTVSPHTFRHSFATHLLEGGANLRAIQEMLGHEDIGTTELYMHLDTSHLRREILDHHPRNQPRTSHGTSQ